MTLPTPDPYELNRFIEAQDGIYAAALAEIHAGRKRTHWMWFIFPQLAGLGSSEMARRYAISSLEEARAYLAHPVLGPRLLACARAAMGVAGRNATEIFGSPDDQKLRSCATLFALANPEQSVFSAVLDRFFAGEQDETTVRLLGEG